MLTDLIHLITMVFNGQPVPACLLAMALVGFVLMRLFWPRRRRRWRSRVPWLPSRSPAFLQESAIEEAFRVTWRQMYPQITLVPQYPIGPYHVDFAHVASRVAIELDGFVAHSSTLQIERDCRRQRAIMRQGWLVFRFGGREVHYNPRRCVQEAYEFIHQRPVVSQWAKRGK